MNTYTYYEGRHEFTIQAPSYWREIKDAASGSAILCPRNATTLASPKGPSFSPAVSLLTAPSRKPIGDIQKFVDEWFKGVPIETMFPRFSLLSHRSSHVSNLPAAWFEFEFDKANHKWFAIMLVVSDGQSVHVVDGSFLSSDRLAWHTVIKDVLNSFRVS
jgi:hypothetical protein